jgi:hypothetical protein
MAMLDLRQCQRQIDQLVTERLEQQEDYSLRLERGLAAMRQAEADWAALQRKIVASRTTWLVAELTQGLTTARPVADAVRPLAVVAADGSQIFPDRHEIASCYLLNLGLIALYYGTGERPILRNEPHLYYKDDDLYPRIAGRQSSISPELVGMKRTVMEAEALVGLAAQAQDKGYPVVALSDGTLILWSLEGYFPEVKQEFLAGFLGALAEFRQRGIPCAGYISQPGATEVVGALRVAICPEAAPNCDRCPYRDQAELPCDAVAGLTDAVLFSRLLQEGEYSPRFLSCSKILHEYGEQRIAFCYLNVGEEIVRLEFPDWLSEGQLRQLLAAAYDQAKKGGGYPVALAEAHEQAVVRAAEREAFYRLLGKRLVEKGVRAQVSYKSLRKRGVYV